MSVRLLKILSLVLLGGTVFAWYTVYRDFSLFYGYEGTIFKIKDCYIPNPVTTPCFYGAFAFFAALVWSLKINTRDPEAHARGQKYLTLFLIACVIFAWANFTIQAVRFFATANIGEVGISCSGIPTTNPFATPCFIGAAIFLFALIISYLAYLAAKKENLLWRT